MEIYGLKEGKNLVKIKVISEDSTQTKEYTISVTKTENLELANTNLETLAIQDGQLMPAFDNFITHYKVEVSNSITSLRILAVPENENGKIEIIGNDNLKIGENTITIVVTATNGITKRNYIITAFKRNSEEEEKYKKEQEEQKHKLKGAYETEKLSSKENKETIATQTREERSRNYLILLAVIISIIAVIVASLYVMKKINK